MQADLFLTRPEDLNLLPVDGSAHNYGAVGQLFVDRFDTLDLITRGLDLLAQRIDLRHQLRG